MEIRDVLRDALVDPNPAIRDEGLNAITPHVVGGPPKISFSDARATVLQALKDARPAVRLGAVQALNVFGAAARESVSILEQMRHADPDAQVRESARPAVEAIRRAIGERPNKRIWTSPVKNKYVGRESLLLNATKVLLRRRRRPQGP